MAIALAALTNRVRLGTTVLVLPYFNPLVLAKSLASLDQLSGGRLTIGVGVGALQHESECLGSDYATRGAYSDESIAIMKELWTKDDPDFKGEFFSFSGIKFSPKPKQNPHPPIWIGGSSNAALRRTAQLGDGWHPNGTFPDEFGAQVKRLETRLDDAGRRLSDITLSIRSELDVLDSPVTEQQGPTIGTPDQLVSVIESYESIGVQEMIFSVSTDDVSRIHRVMEAFTDKVMPRTRG